jgi:transposase InsO family protein
VKDFAAVAEPLHALTGKRPHFQWSQKCQDAFEELKTRMTSAPILAMPQDDKDYRLDTDASNDAIGAVLSQVQDGYERVVAYASRLLTKSERNYCVTRRELLAVVYFTKQFRNYLLGKKFLIRTDHAALRWLRNIAEPVGQQARWLASMEEYEFDIEHRPGKKHANADALSRRPCRQCTAEEEVMTTVWSVEAEEFIPGQAISGNRTEGAHAAPAVPEPTDVGTTGRGPRLRTLVINEEEFDPAEYFQPAQLKQDYVRDTQLATFHSIFEQDKERPEWNEFIGMDRVTKALWHQWHRFAKVDGVLYRKWVTDDRLQDRWQLVPPSSIQRQMIETAHTGMTGGHLGVRRTMGQLQLRAFWPGWQRDVKRFCQQCGECATYHRGVLKRQGHLQSFPVGEPLERLAIDLTGPHPMSSSGHVYILTAVDLFTKWAEAIPLRNKEAVTVARALVDVVISRLGIPLQILSDNGKEFDNSTMKEICRLLGIDKLRTTVYKASTNGAVERFHRTLNSMLGKVVSTNQRNWDEWLPSVIAAYRASRHDATGFSPNFMMFGREVYAPLDIMYGAPVGEEEHYESYDDFADRKVETMRKAYQLAREHLGYAANRSKKLYDMRVRPSRYQVGQWVYYYCPRKYTGRSPKWQRLYTGPFLIIKEMGPVNMRLQASPRARPFICHIDKLKPCLGTTPKAWVEVLEDGHVREAAEPVNLAENDVVRDMERLEESQREIFPLTEEPAFNDEQETSLKQRRMERPRRNVERPQRYRDFV